MKCLRIAPVIAFASRALAASSYGPGFYWNSSSTSCVIDSTTTHTSTSTLYYTYDDVYADPTYTDSVGIDATTTEYVTLTETLSSCGYSNGTSSCSTWTTKELEYSYETTVSGHVTLITSVVPFPTSTADPTTTVTNGQTVYLTLTDCDDPDSCSTWTTSEVVSVYTTSKNGHLTTITSDVPLSTATATDHHVKDTTSSDVTLDVYVTETLTTSSCDLFNSTGTISSIDDPVAVTSTVDPTSFVTVTLTKCGAKGKCTTWTTEKAVSASTITGAASEVVYTSVVPNPSKSADSSIGDSTVTVTETEVYGPSLTTLTIRSCSDNKCHLETSTRSLTTATTTSDGTVTVYTTYCPYSASTVPVVSPATVSQIIEGTPSVTSKVFTSIISDVPVVLTTYSTVSSSISTVFTSAHNSTTVPALQTAENAAGALRLTSGVFGLIFGLVLVI
ncbi:unnamed protein product [Kuraishia capsulata CBS 1993]|uniref:Uncharacterized protein n=1 Tax=Kuraishia capsulata CBS 1993 TaxID=1382522 RepID=W6MJR1_9ASCO|nr:uncharacterized protein KUCA_T00000718001 [Kuraishia capsulata CBS 1993]CDK24752.1 unnamed protein product [Kuraishia capsulata CBS 1993]